jgi:Ca-activated chloride channel homolog
MSLFYSGHQRVVLVLFALVASVPLSAQMPSMKAAGKEDGSVYLQKLSVDVKIAGTLATTTWTMTFRNKTQRILEGELNFPLPAGISVSRYALDINGRMREAVPVARAKGTEVFETVERRRVDPGVLEKVEGNTFRTRIYPINPGGVRTVLIAYAQDLTGDSRNELRYSLPLSFSYPIEEFALDISVIHSKVRPLPESTDTDALQFREWNDVWTASLHLENYRANQSVTVRIPKPAGTTEAMMQPVGNHYFFTASVFLQPGNIGRVPPGRLVILWDASLSGLTSHRKNELELLDAYFARLGKVEVTLVKFSNTVQEPKKYAVDDGRWGALRSELESTIYDGATQFGALDLNRYAGDEFLLFSDGHSTYGSDDIRLNDRPVYAIVSAAGADFPFLQSIPNRTSGDLIDLDNATVAHGRDQLLYQRLEFLGVRPAAGLGECYPSRPAPVTGSFTLAGMSFEPKGEIVLQFGYGGKPTIEQPVTLDVSRQETDQPDLSRVWAQKKIAELDTRYEDNRTEIGQLGRRYSIVTRNTSLIVLENVNDYITYEIEPPADLRGEFDRIMKERGVNNIRAREEATGNAEQYFNELLEWWKRPVEPEDRLEKLPAVTMDTVVRQERVTRDTVQYQLREYTPPRVVADADAEAPVRRDLAGTVRGVTVTPAAGGNLQNVVVTARGESFKKFDSDIGRGNFTAAAADDNVEYLRQLKAAGATERYGLYLQLRVAHLHTPLFYFRSADVFFSAGQKALGLRILSNIAELETENYELYKMLGYKLKELGETEAECDVFRRIIEWRPFEPQSYRDYGLALEDAGHYQQALDTLCYAITRTYDDRITGLFEGIEETLIPEINSLIVKEKDKLDISRVPGTLIASMPVDIRVVVNWNQPNTDIDLWVTDPDNEKCYYAHRFTRMGGRISRDFTRGLGPEQFLLRHAMKGGYKVEVNYYGDTQVTLAGETTIMTEVYTNYGTAQQQRQVITLQMQKGSSGAVYVGDFEFK